MIKNALVGIVAVNENYIDKTKKLIDQILSFMSCQFLILTNQPDEFSQYKSVKVVEYNKDTFSYHDKRIIFKEGFKFSDCVMLLDADHAVRDVNYLTESDNLDVLPGIYPQILWKYPADCSFEFFIDGKTPRVPYGIEFKQYCESKKLQLDNVVLIQESFLMIKKDDTVEKFLEIWDMLADFCEKKDIERNQHILGYGEGYSIGVAVRNSGMKLHEGDQIMQNIVRNFKHFAWER